MWKNGMQRMYLVRTRTPGLLTYWEINVQWLRYLPKYSTRTTLPGWTEEGATGRACHVPGGRRLLPSSH
jgi:hypothetical protein